MIDLGDAYLEVQDRLIEAVRPADAEGLGTTAPATPAWTVKDIVAHVTGLAADAVAGNVTSVNPLEQWRDNSDVTAMTNRQVSSRRDRSIDSIVDEWREVTKSMVPMMRGEAPFPDGTTYESGVVFVTDLTVHEQDVRGALAVGRPPTGPALSIALAGYCFAFDYRLRAEGLGALRICYEGKERVVGEGDAHVSVEADRYELVRALAGRRNRAQLEAYKWEGDRAPYLPLVSTYGERADALVD